MSINQKTNTDNLEFIENCLYSHTNQLTARWQFRVFFSDSGAARLNAIAGYIVGLKHAGQEEFAAKLADDIIQSIDRLSPEHATFEHSVTREKDGVKITQTVEVPRMKCFVGDDGTMHGFRLMWYYVVRPERFEEEVNRHKEEIAKEYEAGEETRTSARRRAIESLRILENSDPERDYSTPVTTRRHLDGETLEFFYAPGHNGGLLYHGPGGGETFAVHLGGSDTLWGIHT